MRSYLSLLLTILVVGSASTYWWRSELSPVVGDSPSDEVVKVVPITAERESELEQPAEPVAADASDASTSSVQDVTAKSEDPFLPEAQESIIFSILSQANIEASLVDAECDRASCRVEIVNDMCQKGLSLSTPEFEVLMQEWRELADLVIEQTGLLASVSCLNGGEGLLLSVRPRDEPP